MRCIHAFLITFLFFSGQLNAQSMFGGTTRAVIIGVSEYENEGIDDLRFAHKDAEAFLEFLRSDAGGNVPPENIKFLVNKEAIHTNVELALNWLVKESNKGDKAIFYFSGHGAAENTTWRKAGFLLTYNSNPQLYQSTAFAIDYLKNNIETLSKKDVDVILISDACRAGKAEGSSISGAHEATSILQERFDREIKILSCQPDQVSHEGEMWGDGRGMFSYFLIQGLNGDADIDGDGTVNLIEIRRYLEVKLFYESEPRQIPLTNGDNLTVLSSATIGTIIDTTSQITVEIEQNSYVVNFPDTKGVNVSQDIDPVRQSNTFEEADPLSVYMNELSEAEWQCLIDFDKAMERNELLTPEDNSAFYFLEKMEALDMPGPVVEMEEERLVIALGEGAQDMISSYLAAKFLLSSDIATSIANAVKYADYSKVLADLLGEEDYLYGRKKAEEYFFRAIKDMLEADIQSEDSDSLMNSSEKFGLKSLDYDSSLAISHHVLAVLAMTTGDIDKAEVKFKDALYYAPNWIIPNANIIKINILNEQFQDASELIDNIDGQALKLPWFWTEIGDAYMLVDSIDKSKEMYEKALDLDPDFLHANHNLGVLHQHFLDNEAIAEFYFNRALRIEPGSYWPSVNLSMLYVEQGSFKRAEQVLRTAIDSNDYNVVELYTFLGDVYLSQEQYDDAFDQYMIALDKNFRYVQVHVSLAKFYAIQGQVEKSLDQLEIACSLGYQDFDYIEGDMKFSEITDSRKYRKLKKKYN